MPKPSSMFFPPSITCKKNGSKTSKISSKVDGHLNKLYLC